MDLLIEKSLARGSVSAPPSKSYTHRYLLAAALADGITYLENVDLSNDIMETLACIKVLGAEYEIKNQTIIIKGSKKRSSCPLFFELGESGSSLRFLIPIALAINNKITIKASERLIKRGIAVYEKIFQEDHFNYEITDTTITIEGALRAREYQILGNISSQFITGLLYALPLLEEDSKIIVTSEIESKNYLDMTIDVLHQFGIEIEWSDNFFLIKGNQKYHPVNAKIEADFSNAAFLDAFNLIGGKVDIINLPFNSLQGDKIYLTYYKLLQSSSPIIDMANCVDLGPILMSLAACLNGAKFINTKRLRLKESDRILAIQNELAKFGAVVDALDNEVIVFKKPLHKPLTAIDSHNDHRIAMAMTILLSLFGGTLKKAEAVNKSYPSFFEVIKKLGIEVHDDVIDK